MLAAKGEVDTELDGESSVMHLGSLHVQKGGQPQMLKN